MSGDQALPGDELDFGPELGSLPSFDDVAREAEALEYATGQQFTDVDQMPDADDAKIAQLVATLDSIGYEAAWDWRRQWRLNEAFKRGDFGAYWNNETRALDYENVGARVHAPIFGTLLEILEARMNATKPEMVVTPRSTDQSALDIAQAANRVAKSQYQDMGVDKARTEIVHKLLLKGTCFVKLTWNYQGGKYLGKTTIPAMPLRPMVDDDPTSIAYGQVVRDAEGIPEWEVERDEFGSPIEVDDYEGCNELAVLDPESVIVDPTVTRWQDRMWSIHRYYESPASIEKRLGFKGIRPDGREQAEMPAYYGYGQRPGRKARNSESGTALVRELIIQRGTYPCGNDKGDQSFPTGYIVIECQGQIKKMPNEYGDGPIFMGTADCGDEQLYGDCIANKLRGVQATFTKGLSNWDMANAFSGNPRIWWPAAAGSPNVEQTGTPGAIIHIDSRSESERPYITDGKTISSGSQEFVKFIYEIAQFLAGVREGGLAGGAPPNIEAAQALRILGERDATRLATPSLNYGLLLIDILKQTIWNVKTFAKGPRLYAIMGNDMKVETEEFAGGDIVDDLIYSIIPESIKPQSDEIRRATALQMFSMGLSTRRDTLISLGKSEGEDAVLEMRLMQQSKRESRQAKTAHIIETPLQLMQWEDHELAIDMHRASVFDQGTQDDPVAMAIEIQHMQIHAWFLGGMMAPFPGDPAMLQGFVPAAFFMGGMGQPSAGLPGSQAPAPGSPSGQGGQSPNSQPTGPQGFAQAETGAPFVPGNDTVPH